MFRLVYVCVGILCALGLSSCRRGRPNDCVIYQDSPRPAVAFVPMIDNSRCEAPWDLAEELTNEARYAIMDRGELYLIGDQQLQPALERVGTANLMGRDIAYSQQFAPCDFVVVTELLEHTYKPFQREIPLSHTVPAGYCNTILAMKVRVRIIDLRGTTPCLILQEIMESNQMLNSDVSRVDYRKLSWGVEGYENSPVALAHQRLVADLVCRIEHIAQIPRSTM